MKKVVFVGSGAIGTAVGNVLARKGIDDITLLSIEEEVVDSINNQRLNINYFPNIKLSRNLKATTDIEILKDADVMDHVFKDLDKPVKAKEQARYEALCEEFQL